MRRIVRVVLFTLAGLMLGAALTFALGLIAIPIFDISMFEGAYAMGLVFTLTPAGALAGAVAGGLYALLRRRAAGADGR